MTTQELSGYYQEVVMPKNLKEGLLNFVQMIINEGVNGDIRNATLKAVDLKEDIRFGAYDGVMGVSREDAKTHLEQHIETLEQRLRAEYEVKIAKAYQQGMEDKASQLKSVLGI